MERWRVPRLERLPIFLMERQPGMPAAMFFLESRHGLPSTDICHSMTRRLVQCSCQLAKHMLVHHMQVSLGGGGGFEGFYGSVTAGGVSKVYHAMSTHCGFGRDSFLVDIGGGLGRCDASAKPSAFAAMLLIAIPFTQVNSLFQRSKSRIHEVICRPLMHALVEPGVRRAIGIEVDAIKCMKSESVIRDACQKMLRLGHDVHCEPLVLHRNIEQVCHSTSTPSSVNYTDLNEHVVLLVGNQFRAASRKAMPGL